MKKNICTNGLAFALAVCLGAAQGADIEQGRAKSALCAGCHGSDGKGASSGIGISEEFPNLAGQKAAYLLKQLKAFKAGTRKDPNMEPMVAALSEADMENLAAYFSSLSPTPAAAAVVAGPADKAGAREFPQPTFVTMKKEGTLEFFPAGRVWKGGPNMLYDAVTPDGRMVLATSPSSNRVYLFDAASGRTLAALEVGKAPKGVKVTPDGREAWVSNQGSDDISIIDLQARKVVARIPVEKGPHNVRFTTDGKRAYVTLQGAGGIGVIDAAQRRLTRVIPVPGLTGPHNLDLSPDEKTAWVRDFVHNLAVVDLESGKVKKVIPVGNGHGGVDVTPDGRWAATAAIGDGVITLVDTATLKARNLPVGKGSHGIRASRDSRWLYVTLTAENRVAVIDLQSQEVVKKIAVGKFPFWIAVPGNP